MKILMGIGGQRQLQQERIAYNMSLSTIWRVSGYGTFIGTHQTKEMVRNLKNEEWVLIDRISTLDPYISFRV